MCESITITYILTQTTMTKTLKKQTKGGQKK